MNTQGNNPIDFPMLQIEFRTLKNTIARAFTQEHIKLDKDFKAALDAAMEPANISKIVNETVAREVNDFVRSQVQDFFSWGEGRYRLIEFIRDELDGKLKEHQERQDLAAELEKEP